MNFEHHKKQFLEHGWCRFEFDNCIKQWVDFCLPYARAAVEDQTNAQWLRCGGTWFAGVNILPNSVDGSLPEGLTLQGQVIDFIHEELQLSGFDWDAAQVSVCYPGYPQPMPSEPEAAFRFRRDRDAAHVDGFLPEGPERRRHLREYHGFILGIPLVEYDEFASPFVVWDGSHNLVREAMQRRFEDLPAAQWGDQDITEAYHAIRNRIFEECTRVTVPAKPGEVYLVHRLALHGVTAWGSSATASQDGRMIAYFRPEIGDASDWLNRA